MSLRIFVLPDPSRPELMRNLERDVSAAGVELVAWSPADPAPAQEGRSLEPLVEEALVALPDGPVRVLAAGLGGVVAQRLVVVAPERVERLALVGVPPTESEVQRAHARRSGDAWADVLAGLPEWEFPGAELRSFEGPVLVLEGAREEAYSPVGDVMWRAFLPEAEVLRTRGTVADALADADVRENVVRFLLDDGEP